MGNFAENLNLGNRYRPPPPLVTMNKVKARPFKLEPSSSRVTSESIWAVDDKTSFRSDVFVQNQ